MKTPKAVITTKKTGPCTRSAVALFVSTALTAASAQAQSQSASPPSPPPSASGSELESPLAEIIVTATKRAEEIQNVPISIQALSEGKLVQHQVADVDDYVKLLPSVSFQSYGPGQSQLFFRGISSAGDGGYGVRGGSLPASGLYVDEVPITTIGNSVDLHVYDIARVEALAGPQGTLFGASSLAGTLRVITNQPDPTRFSAAYDLQGDKFGKGAAGGMAEGYVNIPLTDRMAVRLVGFYQKDGGYIDNVPSKRTYTLGDTDPSNDITVNNSRFAKTNYNDVATRGGRAALKIDLDDNWTVTPSVIYQDQIANGSFLYNPAVGDLEVSNFAPEENKDRWYQAALTIEGKIGQWDVLYAGGYFGRNIFTEADYSFYTVEYDQIPGFTNFPDGHGAYLDPTQYFSGHDRYSKQTHELRVSSPSSDPLRFVAGVFYQRQTDQANEFFVINGLASIPNSPAVPTMGDSIYGTNLMIVDRDRAAFTDVSYDLLSNLTLTGGIREFSYDNTQYGFSGFAADADPAVCAPTTRTDIPCVNTNFRGHGSGETHKVNLSWRVLPEKMLYATWSTGFRPGGPNRRPGVNPYQADTLTNIEAGWKSSWFERRLYVNGAAFIENWNKLQYGIPGPGGVINIYNAGNARVKGVEGDFTWHATRNLTLSGAGTYVNARLTTNFCSFDANYNPDCATGTIVAPSGTPLPIQPHLKVNGTARYSFELGGHDSFIQGAVLHQDGTRSWLTDREASLLGPTRAFTTFDFSAGLTKGDWSAELFIQNAFDERGALSKNTVCVPAVCGAEPFIYPVKPQYFGMKVAQRF